MIKFFRKIRYDLMEKNKTGKYLKYAIGEIVLVVIGILIALQLNILNEESKIDTIRKGYYNQLLADFEKDKNYIEEMNLYLDSNMLKLKEYKKIFEQPNIPTIQIIQSMDNLSWVVDIIRFQSNTMKTLQNTGDIKLLAVNVRNKMLEYNRLQERVIDASKGNNQSYIDAYNFTATRYTGSSNFLERIINQPNLFEYVFKEDRKIQIILGYEAAHLQKELSELNTLNLFKKMLIDIDEISKLINKELEE